MRPKFDFYTDGFAPDHFPYDPADYLGWGVIRTAMLGLVLVGSILLVCACFGPAPASAPLPTAVR